MAFQKSPHRLIIALLVASLLNGVSWAALIPIWHTPDEQAHFAQASDVASIGYRPNPGKSTSEEIVMSEKFLGTFRDERGNNKFTYHPEYRIPYTNSIVGLYEQDITDLPVELRTVFVTNEATGYPPLYYLIVAGINRASWGSDLISLVFLSRLITVLLTTLGVFIVYLLAREVLISWIWAVEAATLVAFHPMWKFVGSGVTSDALFNILYPLLVLLLVKFIKNPSPHLFWLFLASSALAIATKFQSIFLIMLAEPFLLVACMTQKKKLRRLERWCAFSLISLSVLFFVGAFLENSNANLSHLVKFLPNFVRFPELGHLLDLPKHPTFGEYIHSLSLELYRQTFPWYWGVYRWLSLTLPLWTYRTIKVFLLGSLIGLVWGIWHKTLPSIIQKTPFLLLILSTISYATGLLLWNFFYWKNHGFSLGIQGRYFFPNLPEHMIILIVGLLALIQNKARALIPFLAAGFMVVFNWYSLWFVASSYYDSSHWKTFFLQASQYKPWIFKSPLLPFWPIVGLISSVVFLVILGYHVKHSHV